MSNQEQSATDEVVDYESSDRIDDLQNDTERSDLPERDVGERDEETPADNTISGKKRPNVGYIEDPRLRHGGKEKRKKSSGQGRNTESFDPRSTLVRPDMRVIVGDKRDKVLPSPLKHDDVLIISDFFCDKDDWTIYNNLIKEMREIQKNTPGRTPYHQKPPAVKNFPDDRQRIKEYFCITNADKDVGTRFNWYRDSSDWKPFHHDSAAFNAERARNQNITIGVSFGATRELAFLHAKNNTKIYFPQTNGMMFSFGRDVNIQWKHGVNYINEEEQAAEQELHKEKVDSACEITVGRISIILWGNCSKVIEEENSPEMLTDNTRGNGHSIHRPHEQHHHRRGGHDSNYQPQHHHHHDHSRQYTGYHDHDHDRNHHRQHRDRSRERPPRDTHHSGHPFHDQPPAHHDRYHQRREPYREDPSHRSDGPRDHQQNYHHHHQHHHHHHHRNSENHEGEDRRPRENRDDYDRHRKQPQHHQQSRDDRRNKELNARR